ncbi:MAG: pseudouridine synthase [Bulleidia sp.]
MRLDRMLSDAHAGTRSQVKKLVRDGRVTVNGITAKHSSIRIDEYNDEICLDGNRLIYEKHVYLMLNKPAGYISATKGNVPTVMDLIPDIYKGMFPCGRLDRDTEGLLLMTNDGPLAHHLLSPHHHVEKEYYVEHKLPLTDEDIENIQKGITFQGVTYRPAQYEKISDTSCHLIIQEGKYHEIKLIFESLGDRVVYLKRLRMKNLCLDETLKPGEYRPLTQQEIDDLKEGMR